MCGEDVQGLAGAGKFREARADDPTGVLDGDGIALPWPFSIFSVPFVRHC